MFDACLLNVGPIYTTNIYCTKSVQRVQETFTTNETKVSAILRWYVYIRRVGRRNTSNTDFRLS